MSTNLVKISGQMDSVYLHRNLAAAKWAQSQKLIKLQIDLMFEFQWNQFKLQQRENFQTLWKDDVEFIITVNGEYDDEIQHFYQFCEDKFQYEEPDSNDYEELAKKSVAEHKTKSDNIYCFMKFAQEGAAELKPIEIELYNKALPRTCENFLKLCQGVQGADGQKWGYKDSAVHRIVPNGWIQAGDISSGSKGDGGRSAAPSGDPFPDESFSIKHSSRGVLSMANQGPHTNKSQFFITLQPNPSLDKKYVAFGRVVSGSETLRVIESLETFNERPRTELKITDCGAI